ncbi:hypothetical protein OB69_13080 [Roseivirga seohaensis subsp. aquiponti]|uniref:Uncharacterized protein n=1 Tax=Roseivirga seohaensis subsp. aquiponti TaxID=1566026 RepID=A0A0L8AJD6_9BACT|nr:hypothetical protein OB69_13080 [Roseivirga seohaensis subsp. aquiponti]
MDVYNFLMGLVFILIAVIITIIQVKSKAYRKENQSWGNAKLFSAALMSYMAGIYMIVTSF